ncbi:MAG: YegP family protein [Rhodothermia bacterium]
MQSFRSTRLTKTGKYRFRLSAVNGQCILTSQSYAAKSSALKGVESVKKNAN